MKKYGKVWMVWEIIGKGWEGIGSYVKVWK